MDGSGGGGPLHDAVDRGGDTSHLVSRGGAPEAALAFYEDLASRAYVVEWWPEAVAETVTAARKHREIGLADASLLALAAWLGTTRIATLDSTSYQGHPATHREGAFTLLPADA